MIFAKVGRQEPAFARAERKCEVMRAQNSFAGKWNDQIEMRGVHLNGEGISRLASFGSKVAASREQPPVALLRRQGQRQGTPCCRAAEIRNRERFFHVQ